MDFLYIVPGALVGFLVGLTGVGGGSLMAPILILLFGFQPAVAVGTDLWFAAITKSAGGYVHRRVGSPNWRIVFLLALGSVPASVLTLVWLGTSQGGRLEPDSLMRLLGSVLILTAIITPIKNNLHVPLSALRERIGSLLRPGQIVITVLGAACIGCLVTLTSVGAGALVAVMLMLIYPLRLDMKSIVGTDILHAIPLALIAAIGHSLFGNVNWRLLSWLLLGSIPGIIFGSLVTGKVSEKWVRIALSAMLGISGLKLVLS